MHFTFFLFAIVQLLSSAVFQVESANPQPFVSNGVDVSIKDYPHAAAIISVVGYMRCSGTIIGEFSIVTWRYCCRTWDTVKVGTADLNDAKSFKVDSCNPVAIEDDLNSIATVIKVNESLFEAGGKAVKLVQANNIGKFMNKEGSVVGWKETYGEGATNKYDYQLKHADVKIKSIEDVKKLEEEKYPGMSRYIPYDERYYTVGFGEKELPISDDFGAALTVKTSEGVVAIGLLYDYRVKLSEDSIPVYGWSAYNNFGHQRSEIDKHVSDIEWYESKDDADPNAPTQEPTSSAFVSSSVFLTLSFAFCAIVFLF